MSAFKNLSREVRDMIYGYCLIHDEEIIPYPTEDERAQIRERSRKPAKRSDSIRRDYSIDEGLKRGTIVYAADWPCVALLGVDKAIREESAEILFGHNVWRLSYATYLDGSVEEGLWYSHLHHFRHITTHMSMNDGGNRINGTKNMRNRYLARTWSPEQLKEYVHDHLFGILAGTIKWRNDLLVEMTLKTLVFDVGNLFCPSGCCRGGMLKHLCWEVSQEGPWYRKKFNPNGPFAGHRVESVPSIEEKLKTDVKITGLDCEEEKEIFTERWGLDAACCFVKEGYV